MVDIDNEIYAYRVVSRIWIIGLLYVVLSKAVEWTILHDFPYSFDPWALSGPFLAQLIFERNRRLVLGILLAIVMLSFGITVMFGEFRYFAIPFSMGIVSSVTLLYEIAFTRTPDRARAWYMLMIGSLLPLGQQAAGAFQQLTKVEEWTFDYRAYLVDLSLGFNPVAAALSIGDLSIPEIPKAVYVAIMGVAYTALPVMMVLVILFQLKKKSPRWLMSLVAMVLAGTIAGVLYHVFPAAGPFVTFQDLSSLPGAAALTPFPNYTDPSYVRNCMPSMHTAFALLIAINAVGLWRSFRISAIAFVALTILSAMVRGEHYLIDLIVAVPFAVAVQSLARSIVMRLQPGPGFWAGACMTSFWLLALINRVDLFLSIPGFTAVATLATIVISAVSYVVDERRGEARLMAAVGTKHPTP